MSQAAEKRDAKPSMLKDKDFQWDDPLGIELSSPRTSAWCATPRAASPRTT